MGNWGGSTEGKGGSMGKNGGKHGEKRAKNTGKHGEKKGGNRGEPGEIQPTKPSGRVLAASGCRFFFLT